MRKIFFKKFKCTCGESHIVRYCEDFDSVDAFEDELAFGAMPERNFPTLSFQDEVEWSCSMECEEFDLTCNGKYNEDLPENWQGIPQWNEGGYQDTYEYTHGGECYQKAVDLYFDDKFEERESFLKQEAQKKDGFFGCTCGGDCAPVNDIHSICGTCGSEWNRFSYQ